jgi:hypothetical protein
VCEGGGGGVWGGVEVGGLEVYVWICVADALTHLLHMNANSSIIVSRCGILFGHCFGHFEADFLKVRWHRGLIALLIAPCTPHTIHTHSCSSHWWVCNTPPP